MDIQKTLTVPKEFDDVVNALVQLVLGIKAGKTLPELAAQELSTLVSLYGEFSALPAEVTGELGPCLDDFLLQMRGLAFSLLGK